MGLIDSIKNYTLELLGIKESKDIPQEQRKKTNEAVFNYSNNEKPIDKVEISQQNNSIKTNDTNSKALKQLIENKCVKYGINYQELLKTGIFNEHSIVTLRAIDAVIEEIYNFKQQGELSKDVDIEQIIYTTAEATKEALESGQFGSVEEFFNAKGNINKKLGKNFGKLNSSQRRERIKKHRIDLEFNFQQELNEIKKLPLEQQKQAELELRERYRLIRKAQFNDVLVQQSSEASADALVLLNSKDINYGAKTLISTRIDKNTQVKVADYMDYSFTKNLLSDYKQMNDEMQASDLESYSETIITYKSSITAQNYHNEYVQDRQNYEHILSKQARGETLSEEEKQILNDMKSEYYTATAKGIASGVINNFNMSSEEKIQFLEKYQTTAKQFSDYKEVAKHLENKISEKPELEKLYKNCIASKQNDPINKTHKKTNELEEQTNNIHRDDRKNILANNQNLVSLEKSSQNLTMKKCTNPLKVNDNTSAKDAIKNKKNPVLIQQKLYEQDDINEVFKDFDKIEVIKIVLSDTKKFKKHLPSVITELKSAGKTTLTGIVVSSSDNAIVTLCKELGKENIEPLLNRELCYTTREKIEKME